MARYIDADSLIEEMQRAVKFKREQSKWETDQEKVKTQLHERRNILFELATAPTADVRENVHAHWEEVDKYGNRKCSNCKSIEHVPTLMGEPIVWDFCPNCGARMEKEDAEIHKS